MSEMNSVVASYLVEARHGKGFTVNSGDRIRVVDLEGQQPVDFWAFNREDVLEFLSCQHTKPSIEKLIPQVGDSAYTNKRRPIVRVVADSSGGQHDMQWAACDQTRYIELGAEASHANCQDNLHTALKELGLNLPFTPQPWNLFTNFFINSDGTFSINPPGTKPGEYIVLEAQLDAHICVSACPQDMNPTCGGNPTDILVEVGR